MKKTVSFTSGGKHFYTRNKKIIEKKKISTYKGFNIDEIVEKNYELGYVDNGIETKHKSPKLTSSFRMYTITKGKKQIARGLWGLAAAKRIITRYINNN